MLRFMLYLFFSSICRSLKLPGSLSSKPSDSKLALDFALKMAALGGSLTDSSLWRDLNLMPNGDLRSLITFLMNSS